MVCNYLHKLTELRDSGNGAARERLAAFQSAQAAATLEQARGFERNIIRDMEQEFRLLNRETRKMSIDCMRTGTGARIRRCRRRTYRFAAG